MPDYSDLSYALAGYGKKSSPYDVRRRHGYSLLRQGADASPIQSPWQGAARLAQALVGGLSISGADAAEKEAQSNLATEIAKANNEKDPKKRIGMYSAIDPELGMRLGGQLAIEQAKQQYVADSLTAAGDTFRSAYGGAPQGQGIGQPTPLAPLGGAAPAMAPAQANEQAQKYIQYLTGVHGFTPQQAASAVGHIYQESGFNPTVQGDGGTAKGLAQWRLERQDALQQQARASGEDPNNPTTQLDFFANEFKTRPEWQKFQSQNPQDQQAALMAYFAPRGYTPDNPQGGDAYAQRVQYGNQFAQAGQPASGTAGPIAQPPQIAQGGDGTPPQPTPIGGPSVVAAPSVPDVPRPPPDQGVVQRAQQLMKLPPTMGGITANQAIQMVEDDRNQRWQADRERAKAGFQQKSDEYRDTRKRQSELDMAAPMALIAQRTKNLEENIRPKAEAAGVEINSIHQARQLLDAGAFTGTGGAAYEAGSRLAQAFNLDWGADKQANTAALQAALGQRVLSLVKNLGAGTGISNADVKFAERIAGGDLSIGEPAIREILAVGERAARLTLKNYESEVSRVRKLNGMANIPSDYFEVPKAQTYDEWKAGNPLPGSQPPGVPAPGVPGPTAAPPAPASGRGGMAMPRLSPQDAAKLPPGTPFVGEDGIPRVRH